MSLKERVYSVLIVSAAESFNEHPAAGSTSRAPTLSLLPFRH